MFEETPVRPSSLYFYNCFCCHVEIEVGKLFGKGGFFAVSEVKAITLMQEEEEEEEEPQVHPDHDDEDAIQGVVQDRKFMAKYCIRQGKDCRYAFKTMQDMCRTDPATFVNTVVDIAIEAKFLISVRHPNIIKMRALSVGDLCQANAFLILDRLCTFSTAQKLSLCCCFNILTFSWNFFR